MVPKRTQARFIALPAKEQPHVDAQNSKEETDYARQGFDKPCSPPLNSCLPILPTVYITAVSDSDKIWNAASY